MGGKPPTAWAGIAIGVGLMLACATAPRSRAADEAREQKLRELSEAEAALASSPRDEERLIWLGRRLAYLERFDEAQAVYTRAATLHPRSAKVLRHRGHRWITMRRFDLAVEDLSRAWELCRELPDEVEPDGQPNAAGIPIGSLKSNVIYHLALAHYLRGDFALAASAWDAGRELNARNDDRKCSAAYWNHLALARSGDGERARSVLEDLREPLTILENESYRDLCFLLRGERTIEQVMEGVEPGSTEFATRGYGVGATLLLRGQHDAAREWFERVVASGPRNAFGTIAAEAFLAVD